ncbi:MAG TPA: MATE family efflux transporter [Dissulfurispiraceae bacterium]|nr:MATE family efflux transporter [Dissulfurispiraceae bacterium]
MVLIMICNFVIGFADVYVAGLISPQVQAAVGFVSQIYFLIIILANAISIGTVAIVSRAVGAGDFGEALVVARQALVFGCCVAAALMVVCVTLSAQIIRAAGFPPEIREIASEFLRIFAFVLGPNYVLIIAGAVFRASGEPIKPLLIMMVVMLADIAALWFFVFVLDTGYRGIAFATACSVSAGTALSFILFLRSRWRDIYRGPLRFSCATVRRIFAVSWPAAMLQVSWNAGTMVLYILLSSLGESSVTALAAMTNGLRIEAIIYLPAFALNMAASVLVGQNLGAGNPDRAERIGWSIAGTGAVFVSIMALGFFVGAEVVAATLARNEAVLEETARYLRYNMVAEPFMAVSAVLGGGMQGAGDTRGTMWVIIVAMWIIRLPLAVMLTQVFAYGATGIWMAMVASMLLQGLLMIRRFRSGVWRSASVAG